MDNTEKDVTITITILADDIKALISKGYLEADYLESDVYDEYDSVYNAVCALLSDIQGNGG